MGCFLKPAVKRIAIAVLWVFAAMLLPAVSVWADSTAAAPAKPSRRKGIPTSVRAAHEEPVNVTGQETIYDSKTDTFVVKGDAVMSQGGSVLKADEIDIIRRERKARAVGNVHLIDPEVEMWATEGTIDITNETMVLYNAKVLAKKNIYHLEGKQITKLEGQNYEITQGFFTTCGCEKGTPSWSINAQQMTVNVGHTGTARNATFNVLGQPVIPTPYLVFPADTNRHSGLLSGRYGQSGLRGFQLLQPYYIAINKSSDATVALDVETSQRVGGLAEYRLTNGKDDYLWADGAFYDESIRSQANRIGDVTDTQLADPHIPVDRYGIIAMTRQHLTDNFIAYGDTVSVSDSLYLREMNVWTLSRGFGTNFGSLTNAQSNFGLLYQFEDAFARMQGTWNQDLIQPQQFALQRLPDATVVGRHELFNNLMFADYDAEAVNFYRYQGVDGGRFSANPRVTLPWRWGDYAFGYGTAGAQGVFYDTAGRDLHIFPVGTTPEFPNATCPQGGGVRLTFNNCVALSPFNSTGTSARIVPYAKAGISTILDRVYDVQFKTIDKLKNTIQPFADYAYVPNIFQGNQPLFDQIDRLNARSLLTYGFTTRLYAKFKQEETPEETPEATTDATSTEALSDTESTVGPFHEDPVGSAITPHGGNIVRDGERSQELASLTIQQAYDFSHPVAVGQSGISDIEGFLNVYATQFATLNSQFDFNPRNNPGITFANASIALQPPWAAAERAPIYLGKTLQGSFLQVGYSYADRKATVFTATRKNASQFISARAYADVFDRLGLYIAPGYDIASTRLLSTEYGVRLKSPCDCWAADLGIIDSFNPNEVQIQFQVTLGGLGSVGKSPFGRNPFQTGGLVGSPTGVLPTY
ncbi:MAG TPA: LPS assembly protein LptD [Candidatus Acidoferrum sp.]|nr:LPS assembly protein LptD [Candidatus Acidoferrum sp.]